MEHRASDNWARQLHRSVFFVYKRRGLVGLLNTLVPTTQVGQHCYWSTTSRSPILYWYCERKVFAYDIRYAIWYFLEVLRRIRPCTCKVLKSKAEPFLPPNKYSLQRPRQGSESEYFGSQVLCSAIWAISTAPYVRLPYPADFVGAETEQDVYCKNFATNFSARLSFLIYEFLLRNKLVLNFIKVILQDQDQVDLPLLICF